jgi:hypothetical protein
VPKHHYLEKLPLLEKIIIQQQSENGDILMPDTCIVPELAVQRQDQRTIGPCTRAATRLPPSRVTQPYRARQSAKLLDEDVDIKDY